MDRINTLSLVNAIECHSKVGPMHANTHAELERETYSLYELHVLAVGAKTKAQNCCNPKVVLRY